MTDYLRAAIQILPFTTAVVLLVVALLPVLRQSDLFCTGSEGSVTGKTPMNRHPSNSYAYHVTASVSVLICPGWFGSYRIYPLEGEAAPGVALLKDRYGSYFSVYASSADAAERELDRLYMGGSSG